MPIRNQSLESLRYATDRADDKFKFTDIPSLLFFIGWYRKNNFKHDDAHSNWTAQIVNAVGQTCLLLGIPFTQ